MSFSRGWTRCLAVAVALALCGLPQTFAAGGSVDGSIVRSADRMPLSGARLHIANPRSGEMFSSSPAARDGSFAVAELPAESYALAVEHEGGLYVVETPLHVAEGSKQTLNLSVSPSSDLDGVNLEKKKGDSLRNGASFANNPLTAALIVLGAATLVGVALDNDNNEGSSSPSSP